MYYIKAQQCNVTMLWYSFLQSFKIAVCLMNNTGFITWYFLLLFTLSSGTGVGMPANKPDSVIAPASYNYNSTSPITYIILGRNYRRIWSIPVKMPVFDITKAPQNFKITKLGGGQQTKSLRMVDSRGTEWVLRTVDKEAEGALPKYVRNTIVETVVQDQISAAHPYGPLVTAHLAKSVGIIAPDPQLYYVPANAKLDSFTKYFANKVCYLERREPTLDYSNAYSTTTVFETLSEQGHKVKQKEVLKARLLDILVADWDRHNGQWRWGIIDSAGVKYYYPIPVDRDQAFFHSDGLLAKFVTSISLPYMKGFKKENYSAKDLNYKSWTFDRILLDELTEQEWRDITREFQRQVSDTVIHEAVLKLPPEIYWLDGREMAHELKERRDDIYDKAMKYYAFLARDVFFITTKDPELFNINAVGDNIKLTIHNVARKNEIVYQRIFSSDEMKNLYLVGKSEDDVVQIDKELTKHVKVHALSGNTEDLLYAKD
jgi:hypothetical protein